MRETRTLEFKETITNTFLKTVSAFSNYDGGSILFGIDDNGNVKGLPDPQRPAKLVYLLVKFLITHKESLCRVKKEHE